MKGPPAHWTTLKKLIYLKAARGASPSWVWQLLTGTAPLTLLDAVAHPIHSLTQYGLCVQDGTPTPDAPVDIVTNNGALRYGALGSNLYDPSTAVFEIGYYYNPNANGAQTAAQNNFIYHAYIPIEAGASYVFYGRKQSDNRLSQYNRIHWYDAEKTYISTNTYVGGTIGTGVAPDNAVYAKLSCNPQGASTAISEETVLGYNWTFCKGTAEVTPFTPFVGGVKPVGTPEVLTVHGQNFVDLNAVTNGYYYSQSGVYTELAVARLTDYIPVKGGKKYTVYVKAEQAGTSANVRCNLFDSAKAWKSQSTFSVSSGTANVGIVTPAEDGFLRVSANYTGTGAKADWSVLQIVLGEYTLETMPPYQPYHAPQTVTVPTLLGIGNYKDDVELISGLLTHKVGIKVFDGSEDWIAYTSSTLVVENATSDWGAVAGVGGYCTHLTVLKAGETTFAGACRFATAFNVYEYKTAFGVANVAEFKAKIAALYAAGTPVIVVYPLAEETTEQTTPHALHTSAGTNVVDVTAEVEGVTLAVEYAKQSA